MSEPDGSEPASKPGWRGERFHVTNCGLVRDHDGLCGPPPPAIPDGRREQRIAFLERKRTVTIADLGMKAEGEDWHGVQDCASDLRDIDNELDGLRY